MDRHAMIVGAQKCGTSTLHRALIQHPEIHSAVDPDTGHQRKEMHFFTGNWSRGLEWYRSHFTGTGISLDSTPEYICGRQPVERMTSSFPNAKYIVSLRDPVQRAISHYRHYSDVLPRSERWDWRRPGGDLAANISAELRNPFEEYRGLLRRGLYAEQLLRLYARIPASQIQVVFLEEWSASPEESLSEIQRFLGLDPISLEMRHQNQRRPTSERSVSGPSRDHSTIALLSDWFTVPNRELADLLRRPLPASWYR
ncbi:sulfotransferase family protein [Rhodopirellula sp. MGV]|uniref:sulfotransferase family protein n=1 Tax=Rhodopirellula sp. MGV TaxID=2023130 RepID=UPI00130456C6|nr:sulfotransferase [Rhodopirellula sp. MGV]